MTTPFTKRVLTILDGIYDFVGGQTGPPAIDLASPITVVHDVSREAERASGEGSASGYISLRVILTHAAADTQRGEILIPADFSATNFDVVLHDLWLIATFVRNSDTDDFASGAAGILWPAIPPDMPFGRVEFVQSWGTVEYAIVVGGAIQIEPLIALGYQPRLISGADSLSFLAISNGASSSTMTGLFWFGSIGSTPPGWQ